MVGRDGRSQVRRGPRTACSPSRSSTSPNAERATWHATSSWTCCARTATRSSPWSRRRRARARRRCWPSGSPPPEDDRQFAWLSLDPEDADPVRFWGCVVMAIREVDAAFGERTLGALRSSHGRLLDVVVPLLVNEAAELPANLVLVLDDLHVVHDPAVHGSLAFLIDRLPARLRLAVATRVRSTAAPRALARTRRDDGGPRTGAAAQRPRGGKPAARSVRHRARGGPAHAAAGAHGGLGRRTAARGAVPAPRRRRRGAARLVRRREPAPARVPGAGGARRAGAGGPPLPARDVGAGADVRSVVRRGDRLGRLGRAAGGARPPGPPRRAPRCRATAGGAITTSSASCCDYELGDGDEVAELHRRAAAWHRAQGVGAEAIRHALAGGEQALGAELVGEHWSTAFNRGELATVDAWLAELTPALLVSDERLWLARLWTAMDRGELVEARALLDRAERDAVPAVREWAPVLQGLYAFKRGDLGSARAHVDEAGLLRQGTAFLQTTTRLVRGVTAHADDAAGAAEEFAAAADLAADDGNGLGLAYALGHLALIAAERGDHETAAAELERLDALITRDQAIDEHFVAFAGELARAEIAQRGGAYERAAAALERAVELTRRGAGRLEQAAALVELGRLGWARGRRDDARRLAREARRIVDDCADPGRVAGRLAELELRTELRQAAPVAVRRRAQRERAGGPAPAPHRAVEPRDRRGAVRLREHRQDARAEHLREAARALARAGRRPRAGDRAAVAVTPGPVGETVLHAGDAMPGAGRGRQRLPRGCARRGRPAPLRRASGGVHGVSRLRRPDAHARSPRSAGSRPTSCPTSCGTACCRPSATGAPHDVTDRFPGG